MNVRLDTCPRGHQAGAYWYIRDSAYQLLALLQERELARPDRWVPAGELASYANLDLPAQPKPVPGSGQKVSLTSVLARYLEDHGRLEARHEDGKTWYRSAPLYHVYAEERHRSYEKARASKNVLDRTFFAIRFNKRTGTYHGCELDPAALSPDETIATLNDAITRSVSLLMFNAYVGAAFHKYKDEPLTCDEAVAKLKREHPGFCQEAYDIAIQESITGMR